MGNQQSGIDGEDAGGDGGDGMQQQLQLLQQQPLLQQLMEGMLQPLEQV